MFDSSPSRRQFLVSGLAAGLAATAGCLEFGGDSESTEAETKLTISLTEADRPLRDRYVQEHGEIDDRWDEPALDAALSGTQYTTQHRKPFFASPDDPAYVIHEGTYYQLGSVIVDEVSETHPVLRLFEADDTTAISVDASEEGKLPEADQHAVQIAHMAARARGNVGGFPSGLVQRGGYVYRLEAARNESKLLEGDGPDHVTFRGTTYAVESPKEQFHEAVYRPTAKPVAEDSERMEAILKATFVGPRISAADLSSEARQIISEARAEDYSERYPFSNAYEELLRALDKRAYIDGNIQKDAGVHANEKKLIQYEDAYYEHLIRFTDNSDG